MQRGKNSFLDRFKQWVNPNRQHLIASRRRTRQLKQLMTAAYRRRRNVAPAQLLDQHAHLHERARSLIHCDYGARIEKINVHGKPAAWAALAAHDDRTFLVLTSLHAPPDPVPNAFPTLDALAEAAFHTLRRMIMEDGSRFHDVERFCKVLARVPGFVEVLRKEDRYFYHHVRLSAGTNGDPTPALELLDAGRPAR